MQPGAGKGKVKIRNPMTESEISKRTRGWFRSNSAWSNSAIIVAERSALTIIFVASFAHVILFLFTSITDTFLGKREPFSRHRKMKQLLWMIHPAALKTAPSFLETRDLSEQPLRRATMRIQGCLVLLCIHRN